MSEGVSEGVSEEASLMGAWDDAVEGGRERASPRYGPGAWWRILVLEEALRHACRDVIRLETDAGDPDAATTPPQDVADGYIEEAERRLAAPAPPLPTEPG